MWDNKTILLTGATGSFGKKFLKILLSEHNPRVVRCFSRDELKQSELQERFAGDERLRFFIGDIRDRDRMIRATRGVDILVHSAAMKQVPASEYNPFEAVKTNIIGGENIVEAALTNGIPKIISLSTDKAVNPVNLYGATKLCMEKILTQANVYAGGGDGASRFSCVRYGNVVGSRGSIVPIFMKQRDTGTITITDERMTRFWITLEQGVRFVLKCAELMEGGEIFVPKIPSMKVTDIAEAIAPDAERKIIGIRPGEKIHEVMLTEDESRHAGEFDDSFAIYPEYHWWTPKESTAAKLSDGFRYSSDNNTAWMTPQDLRELLPSIQEDFHVAG